MADYPSPLPRVNQTAPVPRRIRAVLNGQVVLDTTSALYVWEWERYPQYYVPATDIDPAVLEDERHEQKLSRGTARRYGLAVGEVSRSAALRVYSDDASFGLAGFAGATSGYWAAQVNGETHPDIAWSYDFPTRQLLPIAGLVAFYNEKADIVLDGQMLARPTTHFS
jgi:uncharacterized protein (DUF427 family)